MVTPPVFVCDRAEMDHDAVLLRGAEGHHAAVSRRLAPGEAVTVTDGCGAVAGCVVESVSGGAGEVRLAVRSRRSVARPQPRIVAVQAIPKGDRGELAVELMTEAGVDVIVPWAAERSVPVWRGPRAAKALARWRSAAREAAKQSRRSWFPEVREQAGTAAVAAMVSEADAAVLLEPESPERLDRLRLPDRGDIVIIIGPEGGVSAAEARQLAGAGAVPARLGPLILRASTAGALAAATMLSRCGRWD
jgi:16S rRNA (uracil1498-N3)-methyltransferase